MTISSASSQKKIFTTEVHSLSHDGRGIATVNQITTFIEGALPHEKVIGQIIKKNRHYQEAKIIELLAPSADRIPSPCPHFGICGGCQMQHLSIENQIQLKQKTLLEQLWLFSKTVPNTILPPLSGQPWGYRRKARLGIRYVIKKNQVFVGFREKNSRFLTNLDICLVLHPSIGERLIPLRELITHLSQFEQIPQIEIAVGHNETALVFRHLTDLPLADQEKLIQFGERYQFSIYLQPNPPAPVSKIWPMNNINNTELLSYYLPDYQLEMQFHPLDFIQVNEQMNQELIKLALKLLDPQSNELVLDLFCGLGNFTLPLSRFAHKVIGIEGSKEMVERAQHNAKKNNIFNTEFYTANLMQPDPTTPWLKKSYDKILLDPPRSGAKEIIPYLIPLKAKKIVYISCHPATLARDTAELIQYGYQLTTAGVINMFPHTSHIEAIGVFEKK